MGAYIVYIRISCREGLHKIVLSKRNIPRVCGSEKEGRTLTLTVPKMSTWRRRL